MTLKATTAMAPPQRDIVMSRETGMGATILQNKSIRRNLAFNPKAKIS